MEAFINWLNDIIWSPVLVYLCLGSGLYFSIRTKFMQVRHVGEMVKLTVKGEKSEAGVSSFQSLALSLSGRVGTGNIAGVATAIAFGGPGSIFWMWLVAFLGAGSAYVESTLAQIYKIKHKGQFRGGPAYYIEKGLGIKWYAMVFAVVTIVATGLLLPGVQANTITSSLETAFGFNTSVSGVILVAMIAIIIFGGIKRIVNVAQIIVPFMAVSYILIACLIVIINIDKLPDAFMLIIKSAFALDSVFGGIIGLAISWGVKRGVYSNEAGQGTGTHAAAAAEVSHPAKQGLVQAFSVYIDTLFVCSATAFMIIITGMYSVFDASGKGFIVDNMNGAEPGPGYTQAAVESVLPGFGNAFVAISVLFFALTTIMSFYYIAETNIAYLNRYKNRPWMLALLKILFLGAIYYGCVKNATTVWTLSDIGVGIMAWVNIIAILLLQKPALLALKDYEKQKKKGKDPIFNPRELGIKNADFWEYKDKKDVS
ncbi:sodium:alanine symporter [[Bacillus thuringiensis] serovar konkukian]|uniref:alanine/glycine:cation symporter family protein n=1 Tax=Bacillus thuringiensis TaxID=1428 RepID=UPI0007F10369|nr:alanine/glycine:cation symporter family protein [Bacillus thuringiensis]ANN35494.1 sodium:alanine symporter [Bacillus thuringiensis serovar coreanensis]MED1303866.1 alanine/glycine:cation symporter family protein [Bacillus pacificus]OUB19329.1 sodium:alanine symporter [[Bacillus thuringiensis] serovar konkukian]